eukprot:704346-Ditylum_brightwellii.AAC.1
MDCFRYNQANEISRNTAIHTFLQMKIEQGCDAKTVPFVSDSTRQTSSKAVQQTLSLTDCFQYKQGNEISKNAAM